jgi:hypothetical protein
VTCTATRARQSASSASRTSTVPDADLRIADQAFRSLGQGIGQAFGFLDALVDQVTRRQLVEAANQADDIASACLPILGFTMLVGLAVSGPA